MNRARNEEGFALIASLVVMMIILALGMALLTFGDVQQRAAAREQSKEGAFALAEAALNAQIFELSAQWPTTTQNTQSAFPSSCNAASAGASYCPQPTNALGAGSFAAPYPAGGTTCPTATTPQDPWGSGTTVNGWTLYVRDNGAGTTSLFSSTVDQTQPAYDANGDGIVWVRSVGVVNCKMVTLLSRVNEQLVPLNFPQNAIDANGFETSNSGNQQIIDTQGQATQPALISVRCHGLSGPGKSTACTNYAKDAQVTPGPNYAATPAPAITLNQSQLASVKSQAIANGTYFAAGSCPSSLSQLQGAVVYIEGPCTISITGNGTANSQSSPGWVVLVNGTLELSGNTNFYGVLYGVNAQAASSDVIMLHGNAQVFGGIDVDGNGTIDFGSSHGPNFVYDPTEFNNMQVSAGAAQTPNSFRILPQGQ